MSGDALALEKDLDGARRQPHLNLAAGKAIRDAVEMPLELDMVVDADPTETPLGKAAARRAFHPHARAKKLPRAAECLVYSLTPSGVLAANHPKNRGFVG